MTCIYNTFSFPFLLFSPNVISAIYFTFIVGAWLEVPREGFQIGWTRSPSRLTLATIISLLAFSNCYLSSYFWACPYICIFDAIMFDINVMM